MRLVAGDGAQQSVPVGIYERLDRVPVGLPRGSPGVFQHRVLPPCRELVDGYPLGLAVALELGDQLLFGGLGFAPGVVGASEGRLALVIDADEKARLAGFGCALVDGHQAEPSGPKSQRSAVLRRKRGQRPKRANGRPSFIRRSMERWLTPRWTASWRLFSHGSAVLWSWSLVWSGPPPSLMLIVQTHVSVE